jgi:rhamnogalacturonan endolyase
MRKLLTLAALLTLAVAATARAADAPVTVTDDGDVFTLSNGVVAAKILKRNGNLGSLTYRGIEMTAGSVERPTSYWSHNAASDNTVAKVTIDPSKNGGERAEISVKGLSNGKPMGAGPGGSAIADIEIRYTLEMGLTGLYTYSIWTHKPDYPFTSVGEARFLIKLNDEVFDWMTVDAKRNFQMFTAKDWNYGEVMNMKEVRLLTTGVQKGKVEHKYDYSANQFETLAWGWSSTKRHVGCWFVNPTIEYLSGGPTKIELSAHRDATFNPNNKEAPAPPCLLNYWRGSHYGGSSIVVPQGEQWTKVIGPFLIYCNGGAGDQTPDALWKDALARTPKETAAWPYGWVQGVDYPHQNERSTVKGHLTLNDPQAKEKTFAYLRVGLAHPDYTPAANPAGTGRAGAGAPRQVTWQDDAKFYQFWTKASDDGTFSIPDVRPGKYTLHAISNNILGEFAKADITVEAGKPLDLGNLEWRPVRLGAQVWEIGVPDRTCDEFFHGDIYNTWGLYNRYAQDFPDDVNYTVGKSDWHKDWNLMQVPHWDGVEIKTATGVNYKGRATTWTIHFAMAAAPHGKATLRLAFAGSEARSLNVAVNDQPAGMVNGLMNTAVIHRDADRSYWQQRDVPFDASLLKAGDNTIKLTVPADSTTAGVAYDYLRLEVDEHAR